MACAAPLGRMAERLIDIIHGTLISDIYLLNCDPRVRIHAHAHIQSRMAPPARKLRASEHVLYAIDVDHVAFFMAAHILCK